MESITLQTNNTIVVAGSRLGQVQFAASAESDSGAARLVAARIFAQGEGAFTSVSNPTSLVFATAGPDSSGAIDRLQIAPKGDFLPIVNNQYSIGNPSARFLGSYAVSGIFDELNLTSSNKISSGILYLDNDGLAQTFSNVSVSTADISSPALVFRASGTLTPDISLNVLTTATNVASGVQTLSFRGSAGELFSITDVLNTGTIFSVNDISGLELIAADADGTVRLVKFGTNVAVGNVTPTQKLHVAGNLRVEGQFYDSLNSPGASGEVLVSTANGTDWRALSEITGVDGVGVANYIARWSDTDTIGTGLLFDNGSNVGIGTTSPGTRLAVRGGQISAGATDSQVAFFGADGSNVGFVGTSTNHAFQIRTNGGNNRITVTNIGNVGIATVSPEATLHVQCSGSSVTGVIVRGASSQTADLQQWQSSAGVVLAEVTSAGTMHLRASSTDSAATQIPVFTADPASTTRELVTRTPAQIRSDIGAQAALTNPVTGTGSSGQVSFWNGTTTQAGDNQLFWDNSNKRLGIGVSVPTARLHVAGAQLIVGGRDNIFGGFNSNLLIQHSSSPASGIGGAIGFANSTLGTGGIGAFSEDGTQSSYLALYNRASTGNIQERFRINSSGNIGIGLTNPSARLHVSNSTAGLDTAFINAAINGTGRGLVISSNTRTVAETGVATLAVIDRTNNPSLTVTVGGNVGIGTNSPSYKLDVANDINAGSLYRIGGQTAIDITGGSSNMIFGSASANTITTIRAANSNVVTISGGSVGILTNTPQYALDVRGTIWASGMINVGAPNIGTTIGAGTSFQGYIGGHNDLIFSTNQLNIGLPAGEKMRLKSNGLFGIRTASPTAQLHINSPDATTTGVIVRGDASQTADLFQAQNSAGTALTRIFADGSISGVASGIFMQRVGIATSNPQVNLEVFGTSRFGGVAVASRRIDFGNDGSAVFAFGNDANTSNLILENTFTNATTNHGNNILWRFGTNSSAVPINAGKINLLKEQQWTSTASTRDAYLSIDLSENGTVAEKFRITSEGNIGIGTTSPDARMHVNISSSTATGIIVRGAASQSADLQQWQNSSGSILMRVDNSGNVSGVASATFNNVNIGLTPAYNYDRALKIHDNGTQFASRISLIGTSDTGYPAIEFVTDGNQSKRTLIRHEGEGSNDYGLSFYTANNGSVSETMRLNGNGNLGIGTSSPAEKLHIASSAAPVLRLDRTANLGGTDWAGESIGVIDFYSSDPSGPGTYARISCVGGEDSGTPNVGIPEGDITISVYDQPNGFRETARFAANGNVGVGTTTPTEKLDVRGTGYFSESVRTSGTVVFASGNTGTVGVMQWNDDDGTVDLGLKGGNVTLQIGQENTLLAFNVKGASMPNGEVVSINGAQGQRMSIISAVASGAYIAAHSVGVVTEDIPAGEVGFVTTYGTVRNLNTYIDGLSEGKEIFVSPTTPGGWTTVRPQAPNHAVRIGYIQREHASAGSIFVSVHVGEHLEYLHDVLLTTPSSGDIIRYDSSNGIWKNVSIGSLGLGTVTSIATNNGVTGGTITTTGTIGLTGQALALHNLATNGLIARTGTGTVAGRTITGTSNQVTVTNGDGVAGNPTLSLPQNIHTAATPTFGGATLNGALNLRASATGVAATQIPVFTEDPASTTRLLVTRTPAQLRSDIGAQAALTNPVTGVGANGQVSFWTGTNSQEGDTRLIWDNASKRLGIGTTPASDLHVRKAVGGNIVRLGIGAANANGLASSIEWFTNENVTADYLAGIRAAFSGGIANTHRQIQFMVGDSSTPKAIINGDGNVGIGTSSPTRPLHVVGDIRIGSSDPGGRIEFGGTSNVIYDSGGSLYINQGWSSSDRVFLTSAGAVTVIGDYNNNDSSSSPIFTVQEGNLSGGNTRFLVTKDGNVGVGIDTPNEALSISKNSKYQLELTHGTAIDGHTALIRFRNSSNTGVYSAYIGSQRASGLSGLADLVFGTSPSSPLTDNIQERMRILSDGRIGIGTSTPNYNVDLQSTTNPLTLNLKLNKSSSTNDYAEIAFQLWSGASSGLNTFSGTGISRPSVVLRALNEDGASARGSFVVATFGGGATNSTLTEKFRIDSNGKVGIGTSSPSTTLHVRNGSSGSSLTNSSTFIVENNGNANNFFAVRFATAGDNNSFCLSNAGNLGLGTDSISAKLHVQNSSAATTGLIVRGAASQSADLQQWQSSAGTVLAEVTAGGNLHFRASSTASAATQIPVFTGDPTSTTREILTRTPTQLRADMGAIDGTGVAGRVSFWSGTSTQSSDTNLFWDNTNKRLGVGTTTPSSDLEVNGDFSAKTKSFVIDHPTKPGKRLRYACLEGPENGVYFRGSTDEDIIKLPDYWHALVDEETITVNLTPVGIYQSLYVKSKTAKEIKVGGLENGAYDFVVYAERKDVSRLEVEC